MTNKGKIKILVIDDEPLVGDLFKRAFDIPGMEGYSVDTASDGSEGLDKIQDGYTALFTDFKMPGLNGVRLIKVARDSDYRGAAFLMSSNFDEVNDYLAKIGLDQEQFFSDYCDGFLRKPFRNMDNPVKMLVEYLKEQEPQ